MSPRKPAASRKKKEQARSACPVASALDLIGDKWTLLVVRDLSLGCKRYGDFLASPEGYPTNILADRLKRLESAALIDRVLYSKRPPRAEYFLNDKGRSLAPILAQLSAWGLAHIPGTAVWDRPADPEQPAPVEPVSSLPKEESVAYAPATSVAAEVEATSAPVEAVPVMAEPVTEPERLAAADTESVTLVEEVIPPSVDPTDHDFGSGNGHDASDDEHMERAYRDSVEDGETVPVAVDEAGPAPSDDPQDQMSLW